MDPMADSGSTTSGADGELYQRLIALLEDATYVGFAEPRSAEALVGSAHREIFFNAARLDRSLALQAEDYRAIAQSRLARIAKR
jgi:Ala-tRNA(Pro) deacylase